MLLERIDHVVFTVRDIDTTCDFYSRALGRAIERSSSRDHKTLWHKLICRTICTGRGASRGARFRHPTTGPEGMAQPAAYRLGRKAGVSRHTPTEGYAPWRTTETPL